MYRQAIYPQARIMACVVLFIVAIAIWQHEFVLAGINANPYMNLGIIIGAFFGVALNFWNLFSLKNEFIALEALNESMDEALGYHKRDLEEERADKLDRAATVYHRPDITSGAHKMISQELARKGRLVITSSIRKILVEEVEERIYEKVSFANYIAGLMILLGLMGTFIGLMQTVGSVGQILSSLDFAAADSVETVALLIKNLKAPLNGMATGFSSSLFGLVASLTLGFMVKIGGRATARMKQKFEYLLNRVAQIDHEAGKHASYYGQAVGFEDVDDPVIATPQNGNEISYSAMRLILRITKQLVNANEQVSEQMTAMGCGLNALREESIQTRREMAGLSEQIGESITNQSAMISTFHQLMTDTSGQNQTLCDHVDQLGRNMRDSLSQTRDGQRKFMEQWQRAENERETILRDSLENLVSTFERESKFARKEQRDFIEQSLEHRIGTENELLLAVSAMEKSLVQEAVSSREAQRQSLTQYFRSSQTLNAAQELSNKRFHERIDNLDQILRDLTHALRNELPHRLNQGSGLEQANEALLASLETVITLAKRQSDTGNSDAMSEAQSEELHRELDDLNKAQNS